MRNPQGTMRRAATAIATGLAAILATGASAAPSPLKRVNETIQRFSRTAAIVRDAGVPVTAGQNSELGDLLGSDKGSRIGARFRKGSLRSMQFRQPLPASTDRSSLAAAFLATHPSLFGTNVGKSEMRLRYRKPAGRTGEALRFAQYYQGIPVFAAEASVVVDKEELREVFSGLRALPASPAAARLGKSDLSKPVRAFLGHDGFEILSAEPVWFNPALIKDGETDGLFICWKVKVANRKDAMNQPLLLVDARDGSIRYSENRVREALNRRIQHASSGVVLRQEGGAPSGDADADHGYDNTKFQYDIFASMGRDSYDNAGSQFVMNVHTPSGCPNAWWDGSTTNFCDGMTTRDIVVHEWTHATTEFTAGLIYDGESGALNESMSDIFGAISDSNFTMGEGSSIGIIRSMEDPPLYGDPDHYSNYIPGGDVHNNSGINNKCGYLLIHGGTFHGVTVPGQGQSVAARIFYEALLRMVPSSQYIDAAEAAFAGAGAAYGAGSVQAHAAQLAYQAIGLYFDPDAAIQLGVAQADFGNVPINTDKTYSLKVYNRGASPLTVTSASVTGAGFNGPTAAFTVAAKDSSVYVITFHPSAVAAYTGTLTLLSNDPSDPSVSLPLSGNGIIPPRITVTPPSFKVDASTGGIAHRTMTISNPSAGTLEYAISGAPLSTFTAAIAPKYPASYYQVQPKGAKDSRVGAPVINGAGGPDSAGYKWIDSDEPGGPVFTWLDISSTGTRLPTASECDDCNDPVSLGFAFPFYGNDWTTAYVGSNGYLTFGTGYFTYFNTPLPDPAAPLNMVAPFFDDMNTGITGDIYFQAFADKAIVQWQDVSHYGGGGTYTYQAVLYPDGGIDFFYKTVTGLLNSATVGIQNETGTVGLGVAFDADYIKDNLAVHLSKTPPWLRTNRVAGSVPPGGSQQVDLTFDAAGLAANTYSKSLSITHNALLDPNPLAVPCTLVVDGFRRLAVSPAALQFGNVWVGQNANRTLILRNDGSEATVVNGLASSAGTFTVGPTAPITVLPFSQVSVTVTFHPTVLGPANGTLSVTSNAEDSANWSVNLSGTATNPPLGTLAPDSLFYAMGPTDAPADRTSVLSNIGGDALTYSVGNVLEIPASAAPFRAAAPDVARIYSAENYKHAYAPGQVIVAFKAGKIDFADNGLAAAVSVSARKDLAFAKDTKTKARAFTARNLVLLSLADKSREGVVNVINRIKGDPNVAYAEPNYLVQAVEIPNDASFGELYGMHNSGQAGGTVDADIDAPEAWDRTHGNPNLMIGIIDTGIDYLHQDLAVNIWTNPGEVAGNGLDDDGNGFIDDIHGYDFANNDSDPMDDHYHGTHCAGTIAGAGNNGIGVAGVVWRAKLVALKFLDAGGSGSTEGAINAVAYANAMHIPITSNSWGGGGFSQALKDVIEAGGSAGYLFIAAAGNSGLDTDLSPQYPAGYDSPSIVSVAATDRNDQLAGFSNYGLTTVDLGAPGVDVYSCAPGNNYQLLSGTSMATPHVSGAAALLWGYNYQLTGAQVKATLMAAADPIPALAGRAVSGGRLNVNNALTLAGLPWLTVSPRGPASIDPGAHQVLTATVDASGLTAGRHVGRVEVATNDPAHAILPLTIVADISPCRKLSVAPDSIAFGTLWVGQQSVREITLSNACNEAVAVSGLQVTGNGFSANVSAPLSVPAFGNLKVLLRYAPAITGAASGTATVTSNAQDHPVLSVTLSGNAVTPPSLSVTPAQIDVHLGKGAQTQRTVTVSNSGGADLNFSIAGAASASAVAAKRYGPEHYVFQDRSQGDTRKGDPVVESQGGPDTFGYSWVDSDQPGGPAFAWNDISVTGTRLNGISDCLDCYEPVVLDFPFSFYGETHDTAFVATHGFLSFGFGSAAYYNYPLPSNSAPTRMVAGFWDDVSPQINGDVYYQSFPDRAVFQWNGISHFSDGGSYTFQIVLNRNGSILYYYNSMVGIKNSATVGVQDGSGSVGLGVAYNADFIHDGMAIRIASTPPWLRVSATQGVVHPGGSVTLQATFDAAGLESGSYHQTLNFSSNAPVAGSAIVDCNLFVEGLRLLNARSGVSGVPVAMGAHFIARNLKAGGAGSKLLRGSAYSLILE